MNWMKQYIDKANKKKIEFGVKNLTHIGHNTIPLQLGDVRSEPILHTAIAKVRLSDGKKTLIYINYEQPTESVKDGHVMARHFHGEVKYGLLDLNTIFDYYPIVDCIADLDYTRTNVCNTILDKLNINNQLKWLRDGDINHPKYDHMLT